MTIYSGHGGWPAAESAAGAAIGGRSNPLLLLSPDALHLCRCWHGAERTNGRNLNRQRIGRCEVSRVANSYWVDERIRSQRVAPRANSSLASVQQISAEILGTRSEVRRRGGIIPSWVVFGMILLATLAVCVTVNMRTRAKVQIAAQQLTVMQTDVAALRNVNQALKAEVQKLRTDPRTIEIAARSRLNMVRANEYVVPVE
jgi:cell division protein FtsB